jgi:hypothetical protein
MSTNYQVTSHGTMLEFSLNPGILLDFKAITPPGADGGEANEITTHSNVTVTTKAPKVLKDFTSVSGTVAFATAALPDLIAMINVNQSMKIKFNDNSSWTFWGWLKSFTPGSFDANGEQPTAEIEIILGNRNAAGSETVPAYSPTGGNTTTSTTSSTTTTTL